MKTLMQLIAISLLINLSSCKKDSAIKADLNDPAIDLTNQNKKNGSLTITFKNTAGSADLNLNTQTYINANSDSFTVSKFKYYISNIVLINGDGSFFAEKESYHLIDNSLSNTYTLVIDSLPLGKYTGVNFLLGVDSARNTSGAQVGALDPANGMFWSWNQGYIFLMMEGNSPSSTAFDHLLTFHLGGFTPPYNCIRSVSPTFGSNELIISEGKTSKLNLKTDLLKMFEGRSNIKFAQTNIGMGGAVAYGLADNCVGMFKVSSIEN
jgi:hypothetical protein